MEQTKITTNWINNVIPYITEHYAQIKLHSPGVSTERDTRNGLKKVFISDIRKKGGQQHTFLKQSAHYQSKY